MLSQALFRRHSIRDVPASRISSRKSSKEDKNDSAQLIRSSSNKSNSPSKFSMEKMAEKMSQVGLDRNKRPKSMSSARRASAPKTNPNNVVVARRRSMKGSPLSTVIESKPIRRLSSFVGLGDMAASLSLSTADDGASDAKVKVHQYTTDPNIAWEMLKARRPVRRVRPMRLDAPLRPDHVRFVVVGCMHGVYDIGDALPPGDVLIVAGDFTTCGLPEEVRRFNDMIGRLPYKYKVVVAGNNELSLDANFVRDGGNLSAKETGLRQAINASLAAGRISNARSLLTNCVYVQDELVTIYGVTIYGSPWQPRHDNWAFNLNRGAPLLNKWNDIDEGIDVLITHTPPLGHGDISAKGVHVGCVELLNTVVKRVRPKYHVFAQVFTGYGCTSDGYTKFINATLCDACSKTVKNQPIIFDVRSKEKEEEEEDSF